MSKQKTQKANKAINFNNKLKNRRKKLAALRQQSVAFPNNFRRNHTSKQLHKKFNAKNNQKLKSLNIKVSVASQIITRRIIKKASFVTLQNVSSRIQLYVAQNSLPKSVYNNQFKK